MPTNIEKILGSFGQRRNNNAADALLGQLQEESPRSDSQLLQDPRFDELQRRSPERAEGFVNKRAAIRQSLKVQDEASERAFFTDMREVGTRLKGGDLTGAKSVLLKRRAALLQIPGAETDDVDRILNKLESENFDGAMTDITMAMDIAADAGIEGFERGEAFTLASGAQRFGPNGELLAGNVPEEPEKDFGPIAKGLRAEISKANGDFTDIANSWDRITASANDPSAAGDLALIFNYMKMLDPGSTVREGEFANAENSAGVPTRIRATFNKLQNGERLVEEQRNDFFGQAQNIFTASKGRADNITEELVRIGAEQGVPRSLIVVNRGDDPTLPEMSSGGIPVPKTEADYAALPVNAIYIQDGIRYKKRANATE